MTAGSVTAKINGLFVGSVEHRWDGLDSSAIDKTLVMGRREVGDLGFVEVVQADPKHHGGPDKAIHHYPTDHYATWIAGGKFQHALAPQPSEKSSPRWG
jgi:MOSC domain-containing protein YiiM